MSDIYAPFVEPGDLVFDVGAHVGDRTAVFRQLGARVVAVEPQPELADVLRRLHGRDADVRVVQAACGSAAGEAELQLNVANPTVATLSHEMVARASTADGWREQAWTESIRVPVTTLDILVAEQGLPGFVKIDVEGLEHEVLAGLSRAIPALSFEFIGMMSDVARQALARIRTLGTYEFNVAIGESQELIWPYWKSADHADAFLQYDAPQLNSGDVYARHI